MSRLFKESTEENNFENENAFCNDFDDLKFNNHLKQLEKLLEGKTCVVYGAVKDFEIINKRYDLSKLNILGVCDKRFNRHKENETFFEYKALSINEAKKINPDYVFAATKTDLCIIEDLFRIKLDTNNAGYKIVSLGQDCFPRCAVTFSGIKPCKAEGELTMPFDVCWHKDAKSVICQLQNDFKEYFEDIEFSPQINQFFNNKYKIGYNHEKDCENTLDGKKKLIERYKKRIENFRNCLKSDNFLFFVYKAPEKSEKECNTIYEILKEKRGKNFKFIIIDVEEQINRAMLNKKISLCAFKHPFQDFKDEWWLEENQVKSLQYLCKIGKILKNIMENELNVIDC